MDPLAAAATLFGLGILIGIFALPVGIDNEYLAYALGALALLCMLPFVLKLFLIVFVG